jgi:hypothetical protein
MNTRLENLITASLSELAPQSTRQQQRAGRNRDARHAAVDKISIFTRPSNPGTASDLTGNRQIRLHQGRRKQLNLPYFSRPFNSGEQIRQEEDHRPEKSARVGWAPARPEPFPRIETRVRGIE